METSKPKYSCINSEGVYIAGQSVEHRGIVRDIKAEVDRLKEMWLDPKDENQPYSPNEEVERLRTALTDRGIKSPDFELPWPYESNPIQERLSVGKKAAKASHEAWVRYHAALDAIRATLQSEQAAEHVGVATETSRDSAKKKGRKAGKVKLNRFELDAIKQYCDGKKPSAIDATMLNKSGAVRGLGKDKKDWAEGNASLVIRAAKKRGAIRKNEHGWEIVTK